MEVKLFQYFNNTLSEQERVEVEAWINLSEENRKIAHQLYWLCCVDDTLQTMEAVDTCAALRKVQGRIAAARRRELWNRVGRVAAVLFIPIVALALFFLSRPAQVEEAMQFVELRTTSGVVSCVTLPDSSKVWLNSNSYLKYPVRFQGSERRVELVGEGYFDVAKDEQHKFVVKTNAMEVEVLGTEFNIDAYERSGRDVRTTLVEGSVKMTFDGSDNQLHTIMLSPGQRVNINPVSRQWGVESVNTLATASWKEGRMIFDRTPFEEALRMIENRFNVEFVVKNSAYYDHNFTGMFTDQRLDIILEHFKRSSNMRFKPIDQYGANVVNGYEVIEIY